MPINWLSLLLLWMNSWCFLWRLPLSMHKNTFPPKCEIGKENHYLRSITLALLHFLMQSFMSSNFPFYCLIPISIQTCWFFSFFLSFYLKKKYFLPYLWLQLLPISLIYFMTRCLISFILTVSNKSPIISYNFSHQSFAPTTPMKLLFSGLTLTSTLVNQFSVFIVQFSK